MIFTSRQIPSGDYLIRSLLTFGIRALRQCFFISYLRHNINTPAEEYNSAARTPSVLPALPGLSLDGALSAALLDRPFRFVV